MSQKKPKAKNLRNILGIPFNIQWSESNPEGVAALQKVLEDLLPLAKLEKKNLKLPSKGETKEKSVPGTLSAKNHNNVFRSFLSPGFQSVIRGLEKNELCSVLMSSDISPPMIQRVVCSYCNAHDIPLMTVPELRSITKSTIGFPTMVLGLKKIADSTENPFFPIYEIVSQNRSTFEMPFVAHQNEAIAQEKGDKCNFRKEQNKDVPSVKIKDVYLYRECRNERVFRPGKELNSNENSQGKLQTKDGMDGNFISFSKSEIKSSKFEVLNRNISKIAGQCDSEDDSDCDSLEDDNIFFVDDKPDHMLLDTDPSNNEENDTKITKGIERLDVKLLQNQATGNLSKKKAKTMKERYFSSKVKENANKVKSKEKKISKPKVEDLKTGRTERKEKFQSSTFNPLTIKTITSNPKKIRRKKK